MIRLSGFFAALIGSPRRVRSLEEAELERRHREVMAGIRDAAARMNHARTLDELKEQIDAANAMMREALANGDER